MIDRFRQCVALAASLVIVPLLGACGNGERDRLAGAPAPIALPVAEAPAAPGGAAIGPGSALAAGPNGAAADYERVVQVFKTPTCGCCGAWVDHIQAAGFEVEVLDLPDLSAIKAQHGITRDLASCHTSVVGGYFVEGHVPADLVERLLREKPAIRGIAVPGMPMGSPGMEGPFRDKYDVIAVGRDGSRSVYDTRQ